MLMDESETRWHAAMWSVHLPYLSCAHVCASTVKCYDYDYD